MTLHSNSYKGYYLSRVGFDIYEVSTGEYAKLFELYSPSASIDNSPVDISATSTIETISRVSTNKFADHTRSLVHAHKHNNAKLNYLMMDLVSKNKSGVAHAQDLTVYTIVYGIIGYHNDIPLSVMKTYEITDGTPNFITPVKMTEELKILETVNDDNPIAKKTFDETVKSIYYRAKMKHSKNSILLILSNF